MERGIDRENHDPEEVQRANGRLIFGGAIVGMTLFIGAMAALITFGVPFGGGPAQPTAQTGTGQQQAAAGQARPAAPAQPDRGAQTSGQAGATAPSPPQPRHK